MLYCPRCQRLYPQRERCPACKKRLRPPEENDPVLLVTARQMEAGLIEAVLKESGLPFSKVGKLGGALSAIAGTLLDTFRFYVPCGALEEGKELVRSVLGEDPAIRESLGDAPTQDE